MDLVGTVRVVDLQVERWDGLSMGAFHGNLSRRTTLAGKAVRAILLVGLSFATGCASGPSESSLRSAASSNLDAVEDTPTRTINWATGEGDTSEYDELPWTLTKCEIDRDTVKYEFLESKMRHMPPRGIVTFMLEIEQSPYFATEEEAAVAEFESVKLVDCRLEYQYLDGKWNLSDLYWHVLDGHPQEINPFIQRFLGVENPQVTPGS